MSDEIIITETGQFTLRYTRGSRPRIEYIVTPPADGSPCSFSGVLAAAGTYDKGKTLTDADADLVAAAVAERLAGLLYDDNDPVDPPPPESAAADQVDRGEFVDHPPPKSLAAMWEDLGPVLRTIRLAPQDMLGYAAMWIRTVGGRCPLATTIADLDAAVSIGRGTWRDVLGNLLIAGLILERRVLSAPPAGLPSDDGESFTVTICPPESWIPPSAWQEGGA